MEHFGCTVNSKSVCRLNKTARTSTVNLTLWQKS